MNREAMRKHFGEILGQRTGLSVLETDELLDWAHRYDAISRFPRLGYALVTFDTAPGLETTDLASVYASTNGLPGDSLHSVRGTHMIVPAQNRKITIYSEPGLFWSRFSPGSEQGFPRGALVENFVATFRPVPDGIYAVNAYVVARPAPLDSEGIADAMRARLVATLAAAMRAIDLGRGEDMQRADAALARLLDSMSGDNKTQAGAPTIAGEGF